MYFSCDQHDINVFRVDYKGTHLWVVCCVLKFNFSHTYVSAMCDVRRKSGACPGGGSKGPAPPLEIEKQ